MTNRQTAATDTRDGYFSRDRPLAPAGHAGVAIPFRIRTDGGELAFYSTTTVFGTPLDITLSELAIEAFFPADQATAQALWEAAEEARTAG